MNTFANAVINQEALTENGMQALRNTGSACVDLFFKIGAMRKQNVIPVFTAAYVENREVALRIAQWARDIRGGAGERKIFRDIMNWLEDNHPEDALIVMRKVPELGRWDDLLATKSHEGRIAAFNLIAQGLRGDNSGLVAKWMPRKGPDALALRHFLGLSPKRYRKLLVEKTKVVETQMCSKDWGNINFSHVPSVASARYKKAFGRNAKEAYVAYLEALKTGKPGVKVNAGAVYPYDVIKTARKGDRGERQLVVSQWDALPNYVGDACVLPMVDVSGSMEQSVSGASVTAMDVAVSLGLYLADKNTGKFKDTFLTFSEKPELLHLKGDVLAKIDQMVASAWSMNTNIAAAFQKVLDVAVKGKVPQEEMPQYLLILSDMQFDACAGERGSYRYLESRTAKKSNNPSAIEVLRQKYADAGYTAPKVVFWNLCARDNVPVSFREDGTALVSGFSPSIMKSVLAGESFTPEDIMLQTIMNDRYAI